MNPRAVRSHVLSNLSNVSLKSPMPGAQELEAAETSSVAASVCAGGATGEGVGRMDSGPVAGPVGAV